MRKKIIFGVAALIIFIISVLFLVPSSSEMYRLTFSKSLETGQPFIKVYDVREPPLEMDVGYGNIGLGTLWLVKIINTTATSSETELIELATLPNDKSFLGTLSFKQFDTQPIPTTGEYYLNFTRKDGLEIRSDIFRIESMAPYVEYFTIEPNTIKKGSSSNLAWRAPNAGSCSITYLDVISNKNLIVRDNLPLEGSLEVNPVTSTFYSLQCSGSEKFKNNYPLAESWADDSKWLFVN